MRRTSSSRSSSWSLVRKGCLSVALAVPVVMVQPTAASAACGCADSGFVIPGSARSLPTNPRIFGSLRGIDRATLRFEDPKGNKIPVTVTAAEGGGEHQVWIAPVSALALGESYVLKAERLPGSVGYPTPFVANFQTSKPAGVAGAGEDTTPPVVTGAVLKAGQDVNSCSFSDGLYGATVNAATYNDDFATSAQTVWRLDVASGTKAVGTVYLAGDGFRMSASGPFFGGTVAAPGASDCLGDARLAGLMAGGNYTATLTVYDWAGNKTSATALPLQLSAASQAIVPDGGVVGGATGTPGVDAGVTPVASGSDAGVGVVGKKDDGGCAAAPGRPRTTTGLLGLGLLFAAIAGLRRRR